MSTVRIRAVAALDTATQRYFIPENSMVFIHNTNSDVFVTDDRTRATLAYRVPVDMNDYTCIGIALTAVNTTNPAFGGRMFTYVAYGPQLVHCPRPSTFVGNSLQWSLKTAGNVVLEPHEASCKRFVGVLLELCENDHVRVMVTPFLRA